MNLNNRKDINIWVCHYFKLHYSGIWDKYKRYGEAVLDADLGDTEGEIREIFIHRKDNGSFWKESKDSGKASFKYF